jgi:hypothetical protein
MTAVIESTRTLGSRLARVAEALIEIQASCVRRMFSSRVGWEPPGWNPASTVSLARSEPTDSVSEPSGQLPP